MMKCFQRTSREFKFLFSKRWYTVNRPLSEKYDAIVIGSGFGGTLAAHTFTNAGMKTLLIESGNFAKRDDTDWNQVEIVVHQRYKSEIFHHVKQMQSKEYTALFPNEVVGGNSVFYGGASLRLREKDFQYWPISYDEMEPFYTKAEKLLQIAGETGADLWEGKRSEGYSYPTIPLSEPAQRIFDAGRKLNLHPFKLPLAINFRKGKEVCKYCKNCDGFPCKMRFKNDLEERIIKEAMQKGLELLPSTMVVKILGEKGRMKAVHCIDKKTGERYDIKGDLFILGAGAIGSAAICLRSDDILQQDRSNAIGRYLMRHCNGVVSGLFPKKTNPKNEFYKQLCFTDFYESMRNELGTSVGIIQDIGTPEPEVIKYFAPPFVGGLATFVTKFLQNLLCIAEDDPNFDNRVFLSLTETDVFGNRKVKIVHNYSQNDYFRLKFLQKKATQILTKAGGIVPPVMKMLDSFSHAVGTLRFGTNPMDSVLNRNCRFWNIENLYALDGSFMRTSGGVNPSLTIAANSLRVSEMIAK